MKNESFTGRHEKKKPFNVIWGRIIQNFDNCCSVTGSLRRTDRKLSQYGFATHNEFSRLRDIFEDCRYRLSPEMSLSVPYHPYTVCLICGDDGRKNKLAALLRCSSCKRAPYCSRQCQRLDWRVHRRECEQLKEENELALALSQIDPRYQTASDGRQLRNLLIKNGNAPLMFVLQELRSSLASSLPHWDPCNSANGMAVDRLEALLKLAHEECQKERSSVDWVRISSHLFGTVMIHRVINEQASVGYKFGENPWFEAYLHNFGEVLDRIKLFAILQENQYGHFLPDSEFPLLKMKQPVTVQGSPHLAESRIHLESETKCMVCRKNLELGPIVSSHDPDRSSELPRMVNYFPPRLPVPSVASFFNSSSIEKSETRLKSWLHIVARTKTIPKEYVCSEDCEQHALYGRIFNPHPLEKITTSVETDEKSSEEDE